MASGMYTEHRRVNPMIREVKQPAPGGAVFVYFHNGDIDNGDLDALIGYARDYLERLLALKYRQPQLPDIAAPHVPTVWKQASELKAGDTFFTQSGAHRVQGTPARPFGEVYATTDRGTVVFDDDTEMVRVAVPPCEGSEMFSEDAIAEAMHDAEALADIRPSARSQRTEADR